jgi:hypothetical protein
MNGKSDATTGTGTSIGLVCCDLEDGKGLFVPEVCSLEPKCKIAWRLMPARSDKASQEIVSQNQRDTLTCSPK